ncbi:hypothetical protein ACQ86N_37710 [Puia sp. P3]|uniref:hypothetical protein n=1 Tax=Puia sp. P3 TaxID=3423952 RepID=UPI003D66D9FD
MNTDQKVPAPSDLFFCLAMKYLITGLLIGLAVLFLSVYSRADQLTRAARNTPAPKPAGIAMRAFPITTRIPVISKPPRSPPING